MRFVSIMIFCLATLRAFADDNRELAKQHYVEAEKAFAAESYRFAAEEYEASYKLYPSPALLWNLGQAYRQFDQKKALHYYRLYLDAAKPGSKAGRFLHDAEERVRELEPVVAAQEKAKAAPPEGVVSHADADKESSSPESPLPSRTSSPPGQAPAAAAPAAPGPRLSPPADVPVRDWYRTRAALIGFSLLGVGIVATGIGVGLVLHGNDLDGQLASAMSIPQADSIARSRDTYRNSGYAMFAVAGVAATVGAVLVSVSAVRARRHTISFAVTPSPSGGILVGVGGSL